MRRDLAWARQDRTGIVSVLGEARPSGPETAAVKRSWKETLGWDDGLNLSTPIQGRSGQLS